MALLSGHGIDVALPAGWDGRLYRRDPGEPTAAAEMSPTGTTYAVLHAASFPLPADRGDFGSGAVEMMRRDDVLMVLVEHGPEAVGTALFAAPGPPSRLSPRDFGPDSLLRSIPGQLGTQRFFSVNRRAFCLYVVLAGNDLERSVPVVNSLLRTLRIDPA